MAAMIGAESEGELGYCLASTNKSDLHCSHQFYSYDMHKALVQQAMYFKDNATVTTLKAQNKEVAMWLPEQNSGSYQAIIDYVKFLLGRTTEGAPYPPGPDSKELDSLPQISPEYILADMTVFSLALPPPTPSKTDFKPLPRQKPCWLPDRRLLLLDLAQFRVPRATLAWGSTINSPWNHIMLPLLHKHWQWAMAHGAFSSYATSPKYSSDAVIRGVIERWLRGKREEDESYHNRKKRNQRRRTVSLL